MNGSQRRVIRTIASALEPFSELRGYMPLPFVVAFLLVASKEGQSVGAYARLAGLTTQVMARYFRDIGARARNGEPGLGLVVVQPHASKPYPWKQVVLTGKGREVAELILKRVPDGGLSPRRAPVARKP